MTLLIILILIAILVIAVVAIYNKLVRLRNTVKSSWSDIDVQCKKRYDLVPNLVETVKGYAAHERGVFEKVTEARTRAMGATSLKEKGEAENALSQTLKSLFAVAENYPNLRASENFQKFQDELTDTEDKIQAARKFYNGNVRDMNIQIETFPANVVAAIFRFKRMEFFETGAPEEKEGVKV